MHQLTAQAILVAFAVILILTFPLDHSEEEALSLRG